MQAKDFQSFRAVLAGSSPDPPCLTEMVERMFGCRVVNGYGMTETTAGSTTQPADCVALVDPDNGALVVGVQDPWRGETVCAVVSLTPGASLDVDSLLLWCCDCIADYKVTRLLRIRDSLPKSGTDKILRRVLRDEEIAALPVAWKAANPFVSSRKARPSSISEAAPLAHARTRSGARTRWSMSGRSPRR